MGEEMGLTHLQQILRNLCFNSDWNYAVFWNLNHTPRMMLTWEDAYYDQPDFNDTLESFHDGCCLQDPLGLAVAKMSYLVYSLGEGIIGQVAVTGKHQWIFADKPTSRCWSSSEYRDGWQTQFSAGIRTIAIVAVVPHGVVQLGSLNTVIEDMKLVNHIKDVFFSLQNSSMKFIPYPIPYTAQSSLCLSEVSARISGSEVCNTFPLSSDMSISNRKTNIQPHSLPSPGISKDVPQNVFARLDLHQKKVDEVVNKLVGVESTIMKDHESTSYLQTKSALYTLEQQKQVQMELNNEKCGKINSFWTNMFVSSPVDKFVHYPFLPSRTLDSGVGDRIKFDILASLQHEELRLFKPFEMQKSESEISCIDTLNSSLRFSTGCELHEALGAAFRKQQDSCAWSESERTEAEIIEPLERTASNLFTAEQGADYLLEAVVANSYTLSTNAKKENSLCKSAESLLTTGKTPEILSHVRHCSGLPSASVVHSALYVEDDTHQKMNLIWDSMEVCNMISSKESSSKTLSTSSKHSEMQTEPAKINRKRARPGESCRPRPRDRQLIQDRVKELRELVPNGSKCSIDSLLERTIKHMFFLQNVTKHADKLRKCVEPKFRDNKMSVLGSCNHEPGSSWALDVGGQAEICPLVVENLNMDGQMLVEMLCEESSDFLEIAEAIRSLGLMILKGVTEARAEKIWACFVVEGQNNRGMHRMDVLWSLMQLLQPKTTI